MAKTPKQLENAVKKIIEDRDYCEIMEAKTINNAGNIYVSSDKKKDYAGSEAIVIILPKKQGGSK